MITWAVLISKNISYYIEDNCSFQCKMEVLFHRVGSKIDIFMSGLATSENINFAFHEMKWNSVLHWNIQLFYFFHAFRKNAWCNFHVGRIQFFDCVNRASICELKCLVAKIKLTVSPVYDFVLSFVAIASLEMAYISNKHRASCLRSSNNEHVPHPPNLI